MAKKDLRQMKKSKGISRDDIKQAAQKANVNADIDSVSSGDIKGVEDTIAKYENKSEGEIMTDLDRMIQSGREDGTFSDEMLDSFVKNVAPMMDGAQRKKLDSIARMIKSKKS